MDAAEPTRRDRSGVLPAIVVSAGLAAALYSLLSLDLSSSAGWSNLSWFAEIAFPPDAQVLSLAMTGMWETLQIAYLGTIFGVTLSLPISLVATRTLFPWYVSAPARWLLAATRVLPSLLWAILFVILVGLGPLAGVLAITLYTVGFVGKLEYEAFEGLARGPQDAVSTLGASRLQVLRHVVLPEAANALVSQSLFMFEYNVRHSSIIGIVGAGGIGFYLSGYLKFFEYDKVLVLLGVIFVVVLLIDALSHLLRSRYLD